MKINKKFFLIRLLTLPLKLCFGLLFSICAELILMYKWLIYGGEEVIYGRYNQKTSVAKILEQNEKIIKYFKKIKQ